VREGVREGGREDVMGEEEKEKIYDKQLRFNDQKVTREHTCLRLLRQ